MVLPSPNYAASWVQKKERERMEKVQGPRKMQHTCSLLSPWHPLMPWTSLGSHEVQVTPLMFCGPLEAPTGGCTGLDEITALPLPLGPPEKVTAIFDTMLHSQIKLICPAGLSAACTQIRIFFCNFFAIEFTNIFLFFYFFLSLLII